MQTANQNKQDGLYDFIHLYKSASETNDKVDKIRNKKVVKENNCDSIPNKEKGSDRKKRSNAPLSVSTIDNVNSSIAMNSDDCKVTSTPNFKNQEPKVKSIMKNSVVDEDGSSASFNESFQRKKRNKSVSFRVEETDEVASKKTKSDAIMKKTRELQNAEADLIKEYKKNKKATKLEKKLSKKYKEEQSNETDVVNTETKEDKKRKNKKGKADEPTTEPKEVEPSKEKKKKCSKTKKDAPELENPTVMEDATLEGNIDTKEKHKKKKRKAKLSQSETEVEPAMKSRKRNEKPEKIAETLENLTIGDNTHTLTNLLDEMTVADKNKRKKNKKNLKKADNKAKTISPSSSELTELENIEEGKEKVKWKKRKWNKDKKGEVDDDGVAASVVIDNIPLSIMCNYKKFLSERFGEHGTIKKIGIAEVYPSDESKPVFTTTIVFENEDSASKALEEDNTPFEGSRIHVSRPLPPTQTTIVVRSYAELSDQSLSSIFTAAGKIRSIRHLVKGKKSKATSFIEFHNPEAVERALNISEDAKIGGKKIHLARFELRTRRNRSAEDVPKVNENSNEVQ